MEDKTLSRTISSTGLFGRMLKRREKPVDLEIKEGKPLTPAERDAARLARLKEIVRKHAEKTEPKGFAPGEWDGKIPYIDYNQPTGEIPDPTVKRRKRQRER